MDYRLFSLKQSFAKMHVNARFCLRVAENEKIFSVLSSKEGEFSLKQERRFAYTNSIKLRSTECILG